MIPKILGGLNQLNQTHVKRHSALLLTFLNDGIFLQSLAKTHNIGISFKNYFLFPEHTGLFAIKTGTHSVPT